MRIIRITESSITLNLPKEQRILGLSLIIVGILVPIFLFFLNDYQISLSNDLALKLFIQNLSFWSFLGGFFAFGILSIYYFLVIRNLFTGLGHILLLILNITAFITTYSSIYAFSPFLITGVYFLTHFKSLICEKTESALIISERIFLIFHRQISIPFNEIKELKLEYRVGSRFLKRTKTPHRYRIALYLFEKDPGFEDLPISLVDEKDSLEYFRPQTLRKTLLSKPFLINSSLFNLKDRDMVQMNRFLEELSRLTGIFFAEENILGNTHLIKYNPRDNQLNM